MYYKVTSVLNPETVEVREYHAAQYGAPGRKRKKKRYLTPEAVKKQNEKNRVRHIQNLMLANFDNGHHIILRYLDGKYPESYEEAEKNLRAFRIAVGKALKAKGIKFHYIAMTERGKKMKNLHHHVIVQNLEDVNVVSECVKAWEKYGTMTIHPMSKDLYGKEYKDLAAYIVKKETKEEAKGARYHISRGLKKPEIIKKEKVFGDIKAPDPPKGWYVDPASIIMGVNPYTGKKYQRYYMRTSPPEIKKEPEKPEEPKKSMKEVNLYIETIARHKEATGMYIVEFVTSKGETVTRTAMSSGEFSRLSIALRALISGVSILKCPTRIKVFTKNTVIKNALRNGWIEKWKESAWKNNKGQQVNCAGLWKYLDNIAKEHELISAADDEIDSYHEWALGEMEKRKEKRA